MPYLGPEFVADNHNNYQHKQTSYRNDFKYDPISQALAKMQRSHYEQVAYLLKALDQIREGDGTVLDHTVVMISSEMGNTARHDSTDVSFVLAGGGGKFKMGRYLNLKPNKDSKTVAHNKLLVSLLQAFGVNQDTYGWPDSKGPLSGLT